MRLVTALAAIALAALALTACDDAPAPAPTGTATLAPTAASTPSPTPEATPVRAPSPTVTATPSLTPTPAPTPVTMPTATPTASPTPAPSPTPTLGPLPTRQDLGIREIDTAEALAEAGLTHVRYAAGEAVRWEAGQFLLNVASGAVEGWIAPGFDAVDEDGTANVPIRVHLPLSPSHRFVQLFGGALHDRISGRTYAGANPARSTSSPYGLVGWGTGADERIVLSVGDDRGHVVADGEMRPVAWLGGADAHPWPLPDVRRVMVQSPERLYAVEMETDGAALTPVADWSLNWVTWQNVKGFYTAEVMPYRAGVAVSDWSSGSCRIVLYPADGAEPSGHWYPCWLDGPPFVSVSPDGRFLAVAKDGVPFDYPVLPLVKTLSIFDTASGDELLRIRGAGVAEESRSRGPDWLADGSGIVVGTSHGERIATLDGRWEYAPGIPAPDASDRFLRDTAVLDREGRVLARLNFGPADRAIRGTASTRSRWGGTGLELRVNTGIYYEGADSRSPPPDAVIERPPFDDRDLVEVVGSECADMRETPSGDARSLACLPPGTVAELARSADSGSLVWGRHWARVRTDDGLEGWVDGQSVRWHSDGVRLEE